MNPDPYERQGRSSFSHYLPRLKRTFYLADAVVFWTMPISYRHQGWLDAGFHAAFREMMLHAAARDGLLCPAYCLMPDHIHLVWMGIWKETDQRNGMKFLRAQLGPFLKPAKFQHQAHDHVLTTKERQRRAFSLACAEYVLWARSFPVIPGWIRSGRLIGHGCGSSISRCANLESRSEFFRRVRWNKSAATWPRTSVRADFSEEFAPTNVAGYGRNKLSLKAALLKILGHVCHRRESPVARGQRGSEAFEFRGKSQAERV